MFRKKCVNFLVLVAGFPGVIGLIDCTHVKTKPARNIENDFVNRKGVKTINVQVHFNYTGIHMCRVMFLKLSEQ